MHLPAALAMQSVQSNLDSATPAFNANPTRRCLRACASASAACSCASLRRLSSTQRRHASRSCPWTLSRCVRLLKQAYRLFGSKSSGSIKEQHMTNVCIGSLHCSIHMCWAMWVCQHCPVYIGASSLIYQHLTHGCPLMLQYLYQAVGKATARPTLPKAIA